MSALLDESLARYWELMISCDLDVPRLLPDREAADRAVDSIGRQIAPLRLPEGLEELWRTWEPASFEGMNRANAGLLEPMVAIDRWPLQNCGEPQILLPFAYERDMTWAIELASDDHPGSRILLIDHQGHARVLAVGIAHFIELVCDAIDDSLTAGLDPDHCEFDWLPTNGQRDALATEITQAGATFAEKSGWPLHWLTTEGIDPDDLRLRGQTHTVADFEAARDWHNELQGTLRGTFTEAAIGDVINGIVGHLRDDTGSIQVFIPDTAAIYGGPNGAVEIDVSIEVEVEAGETADRGGDQQAESLPHPTFSDVEGFIDETSTYASFFQDLFDAMSRIDLSVVVTSVRPIPN